MENNLNLINKDILKSLNDLNIKDPTPIQNMCIPRILDGENLIALSETGSGKTMAYLLPLLSLLTGKPKRPTKVLVITPTKELSEQILKVAKRLARYTNLISTSVYGGQSQTEQLRDFKNGYHLLVACPGRLKDHIEKETMDFSAVETLVLDEADQLMDMGFLPHLEIILKNTKERKQTLLFSATMNEEVKMLVDQYMPQSEVIEFKSNKTKEAIEERFCPIEAHLKYPFIRFILKDLKVKSAIFFTNTKEEARALYQYLLEDKYKVGILEGDMTTHQRKKNINGLKDKQIKFLVATDVASRGLDIPHVTHVFNITPPQLSDSYIHRAGRTARHEDEGLCLTMYSSDEEEDLVALLDKHGKELKAFKFKAFNYKLSIPKKDLKLI